MRHLVQRIKKPKLFFLAGLSLVLLAVGVIAPQQPRVFAGECDANAIMNCGFSSSQDFINRVKGNDSGNGHDDLKAIYNRFGLSSDKYGTFASQAKDGTMYRDGRVVVDGQTVMTDGQSLGRQSFGGSDPFGINGVTYYGGSPSIRWAPSVNSFAVKVLFDGSGEAIFVVINSCGNPVWGDTIQSGASCKQLKVNPTSGNVGSAFSFTASAGIEGLARVTKYVFDFGDGTSTTTTNTTVQHTYSKVGSFTAKLTVYASVPGGKTIVSTVQACQKTVQVTPAPAPKITLTKTINNQKKIVTDTGKNFVYQIKVTNTGNVPLINAVVTDQAPHGISFVSTDKGTVTGNKLNYTIPNLAIGQSDTINITARVTIYTPNTITNKACVDSPTVPGSPDACDTADVVVNPPLCAKLDGPSPNGLTYTFVATGKYGEGVTLMDGDFAFGDGKTAYRVPAQGSTVTTTHTYARAGIYSASATLHFSSDGKTYTAPACRATVKPQTPPTPECKPGIPVGDSRCSPCPYDPNYDAGDTEHCVAPATSLPNTGAGNVVAVAALALVGGFLWYRHILFRKHKKAYMAADFGTSPLPLAEPLETPDPLAATPLAQQQKNHRLSLRRKRQF